METNRERTRQMPEHSHYKMMIARGVRPVKDTNTILKGHALGSPAPRRKRRSCLMRALSAAYRGAGYTLTLTQTSRFMLTGSA